MGVNLPVTTHAHLHHGGCGGEAAVRDEVGQAVQQRLRLPLHACLLPLVLRVLPRMQTPLQHIDLKAMRPYLNVHYELSNLLTSPGN